MIWEQARKISMAYARNQYEIHTPVHTEKLNLLLKDLTQSLNIETSQLQSFVAYIKLLVELSQREGNLEGIRWLSTFMNVSASSFDTISMTTQTTALVCILDKGRKSGKGQYSDCTNLSCC